MHLIWVLNVKVMERTQAFRRVTKPGAPGEIFSGMFLWISFSSAGLGGGDGLTEHLTNTTDFFYGLAARSGPGPPHRPGFTIILRHTTLGRTPLDEWSAWRRDLYVTAQNPQQTDIHSLGRIRTHNPSKRAVADPRLRPPGDWDRQYNW